MPKLREQSNICTRQKGRGTNINFLGPNLLILSSLLLSKKAAFVSPQVLVNLPRASSFVSLSS